jgi:hypothetical protein
LRSLDGTYLLNDWRNSGLKQAEYCREKQIDFGRFLSAITRARQTDPIQKVPVSQYPQYTHPLEMEGDALVLPDVEAPFHNADFLNRCIELAVTWGITQCVLAGDAVHFNSLSKWEPAWSSTPKPAGLDEATERRLMDYVMSLPADKQQAGMELIVSIGKPESHDCEEIAIAKQVLHTLGREFGRVDYILGNHEGRFLAALQTPVNVKDFGDFLDIKCPKWKISPAYFSVLVSGGVRFQIEHPKGASDGYAVKLANKYECNVLMAHSHWWDMRRSDSGRWWAIHMGCCVDETRLPYASQRHVANHAHALGAVIVRDGFPYLLGIDTQWERMKGMK